MWNKHQLRSSPSWSWKSRTGVSNLFLHTAREKIVKTVWAMECLSQLLNSAIVVYK